MTSPEDIRDLLDAFNEAIADEAVQAKHLEIVDAMGDALEARRANKNPTAHADRIERLIDELAHVMHERDLRFAKICGGQLIPFLSDKYRATMLLTVQRLDRLN